MSEVEHEHHVPAAAADSPEGRVYDFADPRQAEEALELAFDYRGDVTLTLEGGRTVEGYEMSFDDMDKYNVPIGDGEAVPEQAPLSHLYLLDDAGGSDEAEIVPLRGAAAVEALVANTYRGAYVQLMGLTRPHLLSCIKLAGEAPVFRVSRRWGLDSLADQAEAIASHARSVMSEFGFSSSGAG